MLQNTFDSNVECGISVSNVPQKGGGVNNSIFNNIISNNEGYGIKVPGSKCIQNRIYNNIIINNNNGGNQAYDWGSFTYFTYMGGGNYWSDHTGPDANGDGFVDTPYVVDGGSPAEDNLPLAEPPDINVMPVNRTADDPDPEPEPMDEPDEEETDVILAGLMAMSVWMWLVIVALVYVGMWLVARGVRGHLRRKRGEEGEGDTEAGKEKEASGREVVIITKPRPPPPVKLKPPVPSNTLIYRREK